MQHYVYGHNRPVYLRQLGRSYVERPEWAIRFLADLEPADRQIVIAEVLLASVERGYPPRTFEELHAELFEK